MLMPIGREMYEAVLLALGLETERFPQTGTNGICPAAGEQCARCRPRDGNNAEYEIIPAPSATFAPTE